MKYFPIFLATLPAIVKAIICPPDYFDKGDGSCYSTILPLNNRNYGYYLCSLNNAYLFDVPNAFQNSWLQREAHNATEIWLGMTCTSNDLTSCVWDNGTPLKSNSYSNFYGNQAVNGPNADVGPCVVMLVSTGQWYSADCSTMDASSICKYSPGNDVPTYLIYDQRNFGGIFRGDCYFPIVASSVDNGTNICRMQYGADIASIHSPGINSFVRGIAQHFSPSIQYMLTGLIWNAGYYWKDNSLVNYTNFGYKNENLGNCVSMALKSDLLLPGQWINSQCVDYTQNLIAICKGATFNNSGVATQSPTQCVGTQFESGSGRIYSPGYPRGSEPNTCEYLITEDKNTFARITFETLFLDSYSTIQLFSNIFDKTPFLTLNNVQYYEQTFQSSTNVIRMVFNTTGNSNFRNLFSVQYDNVLPTTTQMLSTTLPPAPISCAFILDWDYLGFNTTEYIKQRDFVDTVATQLYGSSSVIFGGNCGIYGNIDSDDCFYSMIHNDYYIDAASFDSYLTSKTPSTDCPLDLCDALDSLNDFVSGSTPQLSCLVFFSGGSDDFTTCGYPIDETKFNIVIGAALSANSKVNEISDHLVRISNNFDQNDVKTLVDQIISVAQQKS